MVEQIPSSYLAIVLISFRSPVPGIGRGNTASRVYIFGEIVNYNCKKGRKERETKESNLTSSYVISWMEPGPGRWLLICNVWSRSYLHGNLYNVNIVYVPAYY